MGMADLPVGEAPEKLEIDHVPPGDRLGHARPRPTQPPEGRSQLLRVTRQVIGVHAGQGIRRHLGVVRMSEMVQAEH